MKKLEKTQNQELNHVSGGITVKNDSKHGDYKVVCEKGHTGLYDRTLEEAKIDTDSLNRWGVVCKECNSTYWHYELE